jgi:phage/plasmid-associated DNA primase
VVPFEMKFVDNPQTINERKIDRNIKEELPYWRESLLSILIHRYQNYKNNGLIEPEKVTKFTLEYQMDSDVYLEFMTDNLIETKNKKDMLDLQEVYDVYKFWYTQHYSNKTVAQSREFKKQLLSKLKVNGKPKYIYGFKFYEKNNNENTLG